MESAKKPGYRSPWSQDKAAGTFTRRQGKEILKGKKESFEAAWAVSTAGGNG